MVSNYLTNTPSGYTGISFIYSGSGYIVHVDKLVLYIGILISPLVSMSFYVTRNLPVTFGLCSPYVTRNISVMLSGTLPLCLGWG